MRPRDWFSVGVRLFGIWVFYQGVGNLLAAGSWTLDISPDQLSGGFDDMRFTAKYYLWYAAGDLLLAVYLTFGAEHLTRWAFNEASQAGNAKSSDSISKTT